MMFENLYVIVLNILVMIFALIGAILSAISIWVYGRGWLRKSLIGILLLAHSSAQCLFSSSLLFANAIFHLLFQEPEQSSILFTLKSWLGTFEVYMFFIILSNFAKLMTYSTIFMISSQQCIAVLAPLKVKTWCTMGKVKLILLFFIIFSLIQAGGRWLSVLRLVKYSGEYPFVQPLVYVIVICLTYGVLIFALRRARKQSKNLEAHKSSKSSPKSSSTLIMIFFIVTSFTLTNMPFWLSTNYLKDLLNLDPQTLNDILTVFSIFMFMDPIFTFLSHFIFSKAYKTSVRGCCKCL